MNIIHLVAVFMVMTIPGKSAKPVMIAHAGGGYHGVAYSNSLDALESSYQAGFRYMEMDFSWTRDGHLVCLHDWDMTFSKLFNQKIKQAVSYAEFKQLVEEHADFKPCTLDSLAAWLKNKPEVKIITDIKYDNLKGIRLIIKKYPQLQLQFIPQFYQVEEYRLLKNMGFDDLIWILYQFKGSKQSVLKHSQEMDLWAVSMLASQAKSKTLQKLLKQHRVFVYTINNVKTMQRLVNNYYVSGIYTDFLPLN